MAAKTPDLVIINGGPTKKPPRRKEPATRVVALDTAVTMAPAALAELVHLLPQNEPYTPLIKAAVAAIKAYFDRQAASDREQQIAAIKKTWAQYVRLAPDDKRRATLQTKLDRAIDKL